MDSEGRNMHGSTHGNRSSAEPDEEGDLPEWMLFELLMRLPLKVLFKFKVISKQWCRMISDTSFARAYAERTSRAQNWSLVSSFADKAVTIDFFQNKLPLDGCSSLGLNCLDLLILRQDQSVVGFDYLVVGISNGFLLYGPRVEAAWRLPIHSYEICNPVTGQRINLPPSKHCFEFVATGFVTQIKDNVLQSFRVVRVDVHHMNSGFVTFDVYNSEIRKWEYFRIHSRIYFYRWKNPVVLGKTLHWMITRHRVVAYDPYNEPDSVRLIQLPSRHAATYVKSKKGFQLANVLFGEHQGHLRYIKVKLGGQGWSDLTLWILDDYDSGRWSLQHRVRIDELSIFSVPLSLHPFDSDIVYIVNNKALYSYHFGTRELNIVDDSRRSYLHLLPYFMSHFSFVIPPWPVLIDPSFGAEEISSNNPLCWVLNPTYKFGIWL